MIVTVHMLEKRGDVSETTLKTAISLTTLIELIVAIEVGKTLDLYFEAIIYHTDVTR